MYTDSLKDYDKNIVKVADDLSHHVAMGEWRKVELSILALNALVDNRKKIVATQQSKQGGL